jgi:hypothetical protein
MDLSERLPAEIWLKIFHYLPVRDVMNIGLSNKRLHFIAWRSKVIF